MAKAHLIVPKYLELQLQARWQRGAEPVEDSYKKRVYVFTSPAEDFRV